MAGLAKEMKAGGRRQAVDSLPGRNVPNFLSYGLFIGSCELGTLRPQVLMLGQFIDV